MGAPDTFEHRRQELKDLGRDSSDEAVVQSFWGVFLKALLNAAYAICRSTEAGRVIDRVSETGNTCCTSRYAYCPSTVLLIYNGLYLRGHTVPSWRSAQQLFGVDSPITRPPSRR